MSADFVCALLMNGNKVDCRPATEWTPLLGDVDHVVAGPIELGCFSCKAVSVVQER
jgi:hypothetical protein